MRAPVIAVFVVAAVLLANSNVHSVRAERQLSSSCGTLKRALRGSAMDTSSNSVDGPCEQAHGAILDEAVTSAENAKGPVNAERSNQGNGLSTSEYTLDEKDMPQTMTTMTTMPVGAVNAVDAEVVAVLNPSRRRGPHRFPRALGRLLRLQ